MKVSEFANKICSSIRTGILKMRGFFCRLGKERLSRIGLLIFSVILVTLTLGVIGYYILFPSRGYFHSDTSDTIMWAQAMFDAKWIYNLDFKYAAYLPIGGSLLMAPLIPIFGVSMTTHVWGMLLFYILLLLALAYFFRSIGFSWPYTSFALFVLAFGLAGSEKIREIMYGHIIYYSLGILFLVFSLGMLFRIENLEEEPRTGKNKSLTTVMLALLFLFFVVTGLNGLHSLTLFSIPVLSGYFLERFFRKAPDFFVGRNKKFFVVIGLVLGGIVVGTGLHVLLALLVPQSYADAFASYSAPSEWMGNLDKFVQHWYTLYGVDVSYGDSMKSVDSVINILRIVSGTIILFVPFVALFQYKKYEDHRIRVYLITHFVMTSLLMIGFVFGFLASASWRLSPLLASSLIVTLIYFRSLLARLEVRRIAVVFLVPIVLVSSITMILIMRMPHDYNLDKGYNDGYLLAQELEELGLEYGYATFWRANAVTVISGSDVRVRSVTEDFQPYYYQSQSSWFEDQEGIDEYFVLLTPSEYVRAMTTAWYQNDHEEYIIDGSVTYHVLVFPENIF